MSTHSDRAGHPVHRGHVPRGVSRAVLILGVALLATACGDLFEAENPAAITEDKLSTPSIIDPLLAGTMTEFDDAHDLSVHVTGILADELVASGSWPPWHDMDKDGFINLDAPVGAGNITEPMWQDWHEARFLAEETLRRIEILDDDWLSDSRTAMAYLYAGMSYYAFGDYFCRPAFDGGAAVDPVDAYALAEERASSAITVAGAAGVDSIAQMAHLVRARARLMLGDLGGALSDAQAVSDELYWTADFENASGLTTATWNQLNQRGEATVGPPFQETGDPRVPVVWDNGNTGPDRQTELWIQMKYPERFTDMPIGKWQEARLIEAEVHLEQGNVSQAVNLLNEVRAAADLPALDTGMSAAEAREAFETERKYELFLEGRRYADQRRWNEFPANWGAACIPIPRSEQDSNENL